MILMHTRTRDLIVGAVGVVALFAGSVAWLRVIREPAAPAPIVSKVGAWTNEQADENGQTIMALRPWPGATATRADAESLGRAKYALDLIMEALEAHKLTPEQRQSAADAIRQSLPRWPQEMQAGVQSDLNQIEPR